MSETIDYVLFNISFGQIPVDYSVLKRSRLKEKSLLLIVQGYL